MFGGFSFGERLERGQIPVYAIAILFAVVFGLAFPGAGSAFEVVIYPVLGALLYVTFLQVPFGGLRASFSDGRFIGALLVLNFIVVPAVVFLLSRFYLWDEAVLFGVLLVLLTPCIDYVIVFTELGGGDSAKVLAVTPLLMISQMAALPVYLLLFTGAGTLGVFSAGPFVEAFLILIALPLTFAMLTQYLAGRTSGTMKSAVSRWVSALGLLPVPLLALTLFAVVSSQVPQLDGVFGTVVAVVPVYVVFLVVMAFAGCFVRWVFSLDGSSGRALVFTGATRNSLVVLPLALALPAGYEVVPAVVVTQMLVELAGMLVYVRVVPRLVSD